MEFIRILIPVFCIFSVGFIGQKLLKFDIANLSKLALYLMSPFIAFCTFYKKKISMDYIYFAIYAFLLCIGIIILVLIVSYILKYSIEEKCAMILSSAFMNNGNYGTPVVLLVFGQSGMSIAIPMMVFQLLVMNTLGIYYAVKGGNIDKDVNSKGFIIEKVLKMPVLYAALLGLLFQCLKIDILEEVLTCMQMVGDASIPTVMIILGMQLAEISYKNFKIREITIASVLKLLVSPIISIIITLFLPFDLITKQVLFVLAAMPSAANTTLMAVEFKTNPSLVSSATLVSTILSLITLPVVLTIINQKIV